MKRFLVIILTLVSFLQLTAQEISVQFDVLVYDFGAIAEENGLATHEFMLYNTGEIPLRIDSVLVSCGCLVPQFSLDPVLPNDSMKLSVAYNPLNRLGRFQKSLTLFLSAENATTVRYLNIKGLVIDKKTEVIITEQYKEYREHEMSLQVKPYVSIIENDTSFAYATKSFDDFILGITNVMDADGFAQLSITLEYTYAPADSAVLKVVQRAKNAIKVEMAEKGYQDKPILFTDTVIITAAGSFYDGGMISIRSATYNNDFSTAINLIPEPNQLFHERTLDTALFITSYKTLQPILKYKPEKDEQYNKFITKTVRILLTERGLSLKMTVGIPKSTTEGERKKINKKIVTLNNSIEQRLDDLGIDTTLYTHSPYTIVESDTAYVNWHLYKVLMPYPIEVNTKPEEVESRKVNPMVVFPYQNLPAYQLYFSGGNKWVDTTSLQFIAMMDAVIREIRNGESIQFLVESSSSRSPTQEKYDNMFVAQSRAKETEKTLTAYLRERGVSEENIEFIPHIALVQGPAYRRDIYPIGFYRQFQYLKVIPVFKAKSDLARDLLTPYKINLESGNSSISIFSPIFKKFVQSLIPTIQEQGYVKLIIESSASKVPAPSYPSNDILAFYRAQDAKGTLYSLLANEGIDVKRVVFVETRALVLGPEYNSLDNKEKYNQYDYIKMIPLSILEK